MTGKALVSGVSAAGQHGVPSGRGCGHRVFFALWPDVDSAVRLGELARAARSICGGRAMRAETLHATLAFIGNVDRAGLDRLLALPDGLNFPGFSFPVERLVLWPHNRILWCGPRLTPEPLGRLALALRRRLEETGFPVEQRPFQLHITLLRNVPPGSTVPQGVFAPFTWSVRGFVLVESKLTAEGASYHVLKRWPAVMPPPAHAQT